MFTLNDWYVCLFTYFVNISNITYSICFYIVLLKICDFLDKVNMEDKRWKKKVRCWGKEKKKKVGKCMIALNCIRTDRTQLINDFNWAPLYYHYVWVGQKFLLKKWRKKEKLLIMWNFFFLFFWFFLLLLFCFFKFEEQEKNFVHRSRGVFLMAFSLLLFFPFFALIIWRFFCCCCFAVVERCEQMRLSITVLGITAGRSASSLLLQGPLYCGALEDAGGQTEA